MDKIKSFYRKNFIFKRKEKLSIVTISFIVILNLIVLISLSISSNSFIKTIDNPQTAIPRLCKNIISSSDLYNTNNYFYHYQSYYTLNKSKNIDYRCDEMIYKKLKFLYMDSYILSLIKERKGNDNNFKNAALVKVFVNYVNKNKKQIELESKNLEKIYKIKLELFDLLFKLPLLIILFYYMRKYLLKSNYILFTTFKNVFYVIFATIVISLYKVISVLIPEEFASKLFNDLNSLETYILLYYIMIIAVLFLFASIIEKHQSRYKEKITKCKSNRISRTVLHKCKDKI